MARSTISGVKVVVTVVLFTTDAMQSFTYIVMPPLNCDPTSVGTSVRTSVTLILVVTVSMTSLVVEPSYNCEVAVMLTTSSDSIMACRLFKCRSMFTLKNTVSFTVTIGSTASKEVRSKSSGTLLWTVESSGLIVVTDGCRPNVIRTTSITNYRVGWAAV